MSDSEFLISVMNRHAGWCTIICLVGGGQEINVGEAGLPEWFSALRRRFAHWKVYTSPSLENRDYQWGHTASDMKQGLESQSLEELHLSVSVRSFRAEKLSDFIGAVIEGNAREARKLYAAISSTYPIAITRDVEDARGWLRRQARGTERFGLVASSGATRLKPIGLNVHEKIDAKYWFLNGPTDVRSSFYLEDPATEFDIQGLELDWVGMCWEADLRFVDGRWTYQRFRGTAWQNVSKPAQQTYLANAYRVLLTHARQGMVIFVRMAMPKIPLGGQNGTEGPLISYFNAAFRYSAPRMKPTAIIGRHPRCNHRVTAGLSLLSAASRSPFSRLPIAPEFTPVRSRPIFGW